MSLLDVYKNIKHYLYYLRAKKLPGGLLPTPPDDRDFQTGIFGWFGYTPKKKVHAIKTLSVKDQGNFNTCQWCACTVQKEVDEGVILSVRFLVAAGRFMGLVSGNGFSDLRSGQKVLQKIGILEAGIIPENISDWSKYSDLNIELFTDRAAKHKISSFWFATTRDDLIKLLEEGRIILSGLKWFSGYNRGGGFSLPWLIYSVIGYLIGGHAFVIKGFAHDFLSVKNERLVVGKGGRLVYICQNSFSQKWGATFVTDDGVRHEGCFFVDADFMDMNNYGYITNLDDIDKSLGKLLNNYDGKSVQAKGKRAIFHIQGGKKKLYPNWETFLAWGGNERGFVILDDEMSSALERVEEGDNMDITKSVHWAFLKNVKEANRIPALLELLYKK